MTLLFVTISLILSWLSGFHAGYKGDDASPSIVIALCVMAYIFVVLAFNV